MKRIFIAAATVVCASAVFSVSAFAAAKPAAPKTVSYNLINHDKAAIKWDAVSGAEKYYIFRLNGETGKYDKVGSTASTSCTLKKLNADTEYTYAVAAVDTDSGKAVKSKLRKVTFTTPEEWYYEVRQGRERNHVYRQHYNGSGRETFNEYELIGIAENDENGRGTDSTSFNVKSVEQHFGYVYFMAQYHDLEDADEYDFYRMKNDGTEFTSFGSKTTDGGYGYSSYFTDADNMYLYQDSHILDGMDFGLASAVVNKTGMQEGEPTRIRYIWYEKKSCISNIVSDGEYLYWVASPYRSYVNNRLYEYFEEESDKTPNTSTTAYLWRAKIGEPTWTVTYNEEGLMRTAESGEKPENIAKFTFRSDSLEDSLTAIGTYKGYLYYYVQENVPEDYDEDDMTVRTFRFYRISLTDKNGKPQKLFRARSLFVNAYLSDGKIVVAENEGPDKGKYSYNIYTYDLNAKKPAVGKIRHFDLHCTGDLDERVVFSDFEIKNGYIYFSSDEWNSVEDCDSEELTYYRVKLDGKKVYKSKSPFKWR